MSSAFIPALPLSLRRSTSSSSPPSAQRSHRPATCASAAPVPPNGETAVSRAFAQRAATAGYADVLRETLVQRVADATATALAGEVTDELARAVAAAADARAAAEAARALLSKTRESAVAVKLGLQKSVRDEGEKVAELERRILFLENRVREERGRRKKAAVERKTTSKALSGECEVAVGSAADGEALHTPASPCSRASDARLCLSGLFMYPELSQTEPSSVPSSSGRSTFHGALRSYLDSLLASSSPSAQRTEAAAAYAALWRTVALGHRGWVGEVIHAAVTRGHPELLASANVSPDSRRALAADLRSLQSLAITPVEEVAAWLGISPLGSGCGAMPLPLPEGVVGASHGGEVSANDGCGARLDARSEYQQISMMLSSAKDWGSDDVVEAFLENAANGPLQSSSLADKFFGLRWNPTGHLEGVLSASDVDEMPEFQFVGVDHVRRRLAQQVQFLLNSLPTSNVLLWGPPGTGKSSCVSSLLKEFGPGGLRVIEVTKETLGTLPDIFAVCQRLPQKFCIFVDDLSFSESESEEMRLAKAALEGSLRKYPSNVFVVVTSNRRYPVGSRQTDATEEKMAFTMRFGVVLAFPRMSRATYLSVVHKLCEDRGIVMAKDEVDELALAWALGQDGNSSNSLSGRTARQFTDHVCSAQALSAITGEEAEYLASKGNSNATSVAANSMWASSAEGAAHIQH